LLVVPRGRVHLRSGSLVFGQKPVAQLTEQLPELQLADATFVCALPPQIRSQAPQLSPSAVTFTSQPFSASPSQSSKPAAQPSPSKSMRHTPSSQTPWAFAGAHTSPHPPQLLRSASVFTSQPSEARSLQSAVPEAHTNVQRPSSHSAAASSGGALQSPSSTQALPTSHPSQGPPQSTSISPPFFTRSVQLASAQVPLLQIVLAQSAPFAHFFPASQGAHSAPPQSTSVSVPLRTSSTQEADWQPPPVQLSLTQSPSARQSRPRAQGGQSIPPQSMSVSSASLVRFSQCETGPLPPGPMSRSLKSKSGVRHEVGNRAATSNVSSQPPTWLRRSQPARRRETRKGIPLRYHAPLGREPGMPRRAGVDARRL